VGDVVAQPARLAALAGDVTNALTVEAFWLFDVAVATATDSSSFATSERVASGVGVATVGVVVGLAAVAAGDTSPLGNFAHGARGVIFDRHEAGQYDTLVVLNDHEARRYVTLVGRHVD
jgi:hypothetical protein